VTETSPERAGTPVLSPQTLSQAVLATAGIALTTLLYGSFFAAGSYLTVLITATLVASASALAAEVLRLRNRWAVVTAAVGFLVTAMYTVLPGTLRGPLPGPATLRVGWRALTGGWAAMLSVAAPAPDSPQMLMTPALITWLAGFLAVSLILRTRSVLGPAAAVVAAETAGLMFASNQPVSHLSQAVSVVAVLLLLIMIRASSSGHAPYRGSPIRAGAIRIVLLAAVAGAGLLGALASGPVDAAQRYNPRDLLTPPLRLDQSFNALSEVRAQLRISPARKLFTITISGARDPVDRVQTVALESFDGTEWTSPDTFRVAGQVLAAGPAVSGAATLTEHVTLHGLPGPYLPVAGWPKDVDASFGPGTQIGFDPASGTLVASAYARSQSSYSVVAWGQPTAVGLADAPVGSGAIFRPYTSVPPVPAPLAALATRITAMAGTPYAKLAALELYLRRLPVSRKAPPGDSYGTLERLLSARTRRGQAGYADQHAAAFTVLARIEHLPTRIAVGYRLPAARHGGQARTFTITTADAYAWAQAYFQGYGWVDFDPTDTSNTVALPQAVTPPVPPRKTPPIITPRSQPTRPPARAPRPRPSASQSAPALTRPNLPLGTLVLALSLTVCAVVAGSTAARRLLRRRRHTSRRVIGAWEATVDRLASAGMTLDRSQTPLELAARARGCALARTTREQRVLALAAPYLAELAAGVTEAAFSGKSASAQDSDRAWALERQLRQALYRGRRVIYLAAYWALPRPRPRRAGAQ
jgi:Transglutaminase-like superfamily/TgpA N-terminal domain/Domain of unknown function (DUF4129)